MEMVKYRQYSEEERNARGLFLNYLKSIKEKVENGEFEPSVDWETIWVLSGPEHEFSEEKAHNAEDSVANQTKERIEKGFELVKEVTALRANKRIKELELEDYKLHAPTLYYNGGEGRGESFRKMIESGDVQKTYGIPAEVIRISEHDPEILHTGHQFDEYPDDLLRKGKTIVVTSWYHTPRTQEYITKKSQEENIPELEDMMLVYPAGLSRLRVGRAVGEAKKVWDYFNKTV